MRCTPVWLLAVSACVPSYRDAWDGTWEVVEHLGGPGCESPVEPVAEPWAKVVFELSRTSSQVAFTVCTSDTCPEAATAVLLLEAVDDTQMYSKTTSTALLTTSQCQVQYSTFDVEKTGEDSAVFRNQNLDAILAAGQGDDCDALVNDLIGVECDDTIEVELRR